MKIIALGKQAEPEQKMAEPSAKLRIVSMGEEGSQEEPEGLVKSSLRTGLQLAKGLANFIPGVAAHQFLNPSGAEARADALNDLDHILHQGWITQDQYEKAKKEIEESGVEAASPSLGNLYRKVEEKTGLPLEAKNPLQKGIETTSNITALSHGGLPARVGTGIAAGLLKGESENMGIPEEISDPLVALASLGVNRSLTNPQRPGAPTPRQALPPPATPPPATPPPATPPHPQQKQWEATQHLLHLLQKLHKEGKVLGRI